MLSIFEQSIAEFQSFSSKSLPHSDFLVGKVLVGQTASCTSLFEVRSINVEKYFYDFDIVDILVLTKIKYYDTLIRV